MAEEKENNSGGEMSSLYRKRWGNLAPREGPLRDLCCRWTDKLHSLLLFAIVSAQNDIIATAWHHFCTAWHHSYTVCCILPPVQCAMKPIILPSSNLQSRGWNMFHHHLFLPILSTSILSGSMNLLLLVLLPLPPPDFLSFNFIIVLIYSSMLV